MSRQELAKFIRELRLDMFLDNYWVNNKLLEAEEELNINPDESYDEGYEDGKNFAEDSEYKGTYEEGRADAITEIIMHLEDLK